jgi:hypothetical protein
MSPLSAAATESAMDAQPSSTARPTVVTLTLEFDGVTFVPGALYDALNAAYGTVTLKQDAVGPYSYNFKIAA